MPSSTAVTSTLPRRSPWPFPMKEPKSASVGSSRKRAIRRLAKSGWWVSSKHAKSQTFLLFNIASVAGNVGWSLAKGKTLKRDEGGGDDHSHPFLPTFDYCTYQIYYIYVIYTHQKIG